MVGARKGSSNRRGFPFMATKSAFTKPPQKASDHIALFKQRGVTFSAAEESDAYRLLSMVGYFRLSGYSLPFQLAAGPLVAPHQVKQGTTFSHIADLYRFDEALRHRCGEALQRVEVALKAVVCNKMSLKYGTGHWFAEDNVFLPLVEDEVIGRIGKALEFDFANATTVPDRRQGVYPYLDKYYKKHHGPAPGWMLREVGSFGLWSLMFDSIADNAMRQTIANEFKYPDGKAIDQELLRGWMHSLTVFRNTCAHHHRLVQKVFTFVPGTPGRAPWDTFVPPNEPTLRSALTVLAFLERGTVQGSTWLASIRSLFDAYDARVDINAAVGFDFGTGWKADVLWTLPP